MNKLDIDILKKFIPREDISGFMAFENIIEYDNRIVVIYRAPFSEKITISRVDYESELKSRNRSEKLNTIFEEHDVAGM